MSGLSVKVEGKARLRELLSPERLREFMAGALTESALFGVSVIQRDTPKDSGETAAAWEITEAEPHLLEAWISNSHRVRGFLVAAGIEFGTPAHTIRPGPGKFALVFTASKSSAPVEGRVHSGTAKQINVVKAQLAAGGHRTRGSFLMNKGTGIKSAARYGNFVATQRGMKRIIAHDLASGKPQYRRRGTAPGSPAGLITADDRSRTVVIVTKVLHPGTRPNPVIRRNIGVIRRFLWERCAQAAASLNR